MLSLDPLFIQFDAYDPWEPFATGSRLVEDLGSERPTLWKPLNWVDDYPFIGVDGIFYYYP